MKLINLNFLIVLAEVFALLCDASGNTISIKTKYGTIGGYRYNEKINAFPGVPYAQPPVAEWRFEPARKLETLHNKQEPYDGRNYENVMCAQRISILTAKPEIMGQEDCLYLNIYTPSKIANIKLPVMIYLHGGGFAFGTGTIYKPDYLLRGEDVILVTINYRVGPFGFLTAGESNEKIYANTGLKDQLMAIQWIHENIEHFNGDPARITLFGNSAGGASSHLHLFSPKSKGLFQNIILQSGAGNCHWALKDHEYSVQLTRKFAQLNDCPTNSNKDMIACLKMKPVEDLLMSLNEFEVLDTEPIVIFTPTIEPQHNDAFLTDTLENLLKKGQFIDVPIMEGLTSEEGALRSAPFAVSEELLQKFNKHFNELYKINSFHYTMSTENVKEIRKFYFGNDELTQANMGKITDLFTDACFGCVDGALDLHRPYAKSPLYSFFFKYKGSLSFTQIFGGNENTELGVCHMDELFYLFPLEFFFHKYKNNTLSERDLQLSDIMVKLWVYYATNTNLNDLSKTLQIDWQPVTTTNNEHLLIGDEIKMGKNAFDPKVKQFWNQMTTTEL